MQQLNVFPEQPKEVDHLLKAIDSSYDDEKVLSEAYDISRNALISVRHNASRRLKEICIHPDTRIEIEHDYRNNIDQELTFCTVCNKFLKRV